MSLKTHFQTLPEVSQEELLRIESYQQKYHYEILAITARPGDKVEPQKVLGKFGIFLTKSRTRVWMADIKQAIFVIEYCPHEIEYDGLCCNCGQDVSLIQEKNPQMYQRKTAALIVGGVTVQGHSHESGNTSHVSSKQKMLRLTYNALHHTSEENSEHLLKQRKLALVLDIDHTFLHATRDPQALQVAEDVSFCQDVHSFVLPGHKTPYFIKLRPGFLQFLQSIQKYYEIHLYTMSMRKYAEEIVKYIDHRMFQLSKTANHSNHSRQQLIKNLVTRDDVHSSKKYLHCIYPCDDRMVMIVDDRVDVWPSAVNNVIQIHKCYSTQTQLLSNIIHAIQTNIKKKMPTLLFVCLLAYLCYNGPIMDTDLFWPSEDAIISNTRMQDRMGVTLIALTGTITPNSDTAKSIRKYCLDYFRELGVYSIEVEPDSIQIFTHRSPDQIKLVKFQQSITENTNCSWLQPLQNAKIEYKVNFTELRRKEGDQVLSCLAHVLVKIHQLFYQQWDKMSNKVKTGSKTTSKKRVHFDLTVSSPQNLANEIIKTNEESKHNDDAQTSNISSNTNTDTATQSQETQNITNNDNNSNGDKNDNANDNDNEESNEDDNINDDLPHDRINHEKASPIPRPDVRKLLKKLKQKVFQGNVFVFSGLFPVNTNLERTYEWKLSIEFGAKCVTTLSPGNVEQVTHCIAPKMGTNKTNIALQCGIEIVHPHWLYNSTTHYLKSDPKMYRPSGWAPEKHEAPGKANLPTQKIENNKGRNILVVYKSKLSCFQNNLGLPISTKKRKRVQEKSNEMDVDMNIGTKPSVKRSKKHDNPQHEQASEDMKPDLLNASTAISEKKLDQEYLFNIPVNKSSNYEDLETIVGSNESATTNNSTDASMTMSHNAINEEEIPDDTINQLLDEELAALM
ncbi:hypothetical protein RFI_09458 [Reticulomyxa filosa]|uniref:protein-serine/threonine phosphatase n=1 Tax=Reticulomyxa filosa TaxID=46433 RepID=X6NN23_RETFI|nr:hypothetical protein RFI_09458 [Reticulomyxa filosa]|eukprot:ETO27675.1 hypothetical protein RFI_09458 [Reticulomyxa filosa]